MPYVSEQQRKWANSPAGVKAMGQATVNEFNRASKKMSLPRKVPKRRTTPRRTDVVVAASYG